MKIGADITQHRFEVGTLGKDTVGVNVPEVTDPSTLPLPVVNTYDVGTYGYVDWQVNSRLDINAGVRISGQLSSDSLSTFFAVLPRVSLAYRLSKKLSLHADAGLSRQYIHQVSTLNPGLPRDLWVPSVNGLTPQENQYVSLGCTFESSKKQSFGLDLFANRLEGLSRFSNDAIGASLEDWGNTIRRGKGYSYGLELKYAGNLSNLQYDLSYTYSIANRQFEDLFGLSQEEERFKFDRRHLSNLNLRYPITEKWGVGTNTCFGFRFASKNS